MTAQTSLGDRIRMEAAIADRPGQLGRLEQIAAEVDRLLAQVAAVEALAKKWDGADRVGQHRWGALEPSADALRATLASWDGEQS